MRRTFKRHSFRSGLEDKVAADLTSRGVPFQYEELVLEYEQPSKPRKYTPDFVLPNGIVIETKGYFPAEDRSKMLWVRKSNPTKDLRLVFQNPSNRIYKSSPTTYAMWADKNGFKWACKTVPKEWVDEAGGPL